MKEVILTVGDTWLMKAQVQIDVGDTSASGYYASNLQLQLYRLGLTLDKFYTV
ncbi:hypothetical protein AGMMS49593_08680 [Endomicrobiia bacterium]|nr:hypothetical protein AGMMS49593_08680 [Endomicrobiia bacterium]GHT46453.1 hypothetical protein AGMMS49936_05410 [Endomicrobiia bacterium]